MKAAVARDEPRGRATSARVLSHARLEHVFMQPPPGEFPRLTLTWLVTDRQYGEAARLERRAKVLGVGRKKWREK